ncbi:hypothetical protein L596_005670 [Steinernema carpocapsae]|uniref:Uncharacterized protein n=1 Tax=Steinernema carpocapsae TaxID=34508 RepID=A0A4U8UZW5_STECR|nr:hypothetical protein L596_005670 [Steinernema carpocapsae]
MDAANSERSGRSSTFSIATRPDKAKEIMPPAMHPMQQHPQQAQTGVPGVSLISCELHAIWVSSVTCATSDICSPNSRPQGSRVPGAFAWKRALIASGIKDQSITEGSALLRRSIGQVGVLSAKRRARCKKRKAIGKSIGKPGNRLKTEASTKIFERQGKQHVIREKRVKPKEGRENI